MTLYLHKNSAKPEIFCTVQGEGVHAGVPSFFVRLQGCDVHCFFCDEKETWVRREHFTELLEPEKIIEEFEILNPLLKRVVITGGEPTQQELKPFINKLIEQNFSVSLETAATGEFVTDLFEDYHNPLWITFSPKEVYSKSTKVEDERIWARCDEIKFVIANDEAEEYLLRTIMPKLADNKNHCPIFLVPDWFNFEKMKAKVIELCMQYPNKFRIGTQTHKFLEMP